MTETALSAPLARTADAPSAKVKPKATISRKTLIAVGVAVVAAAAGVAYILAPKNLQSTDAAYVQADSSIVAPKVRGLVAVVLVQHNQAVRRGDPLVRIDPEEFDAKIQAADAELQTSLASVQAANAALVALDAEERLAAANVRAARTSIGSADAQNVRAEADHKRYETLVASGAVARRDADTFRAAAVTAQSDADHSRAELAVSQNQAAVTEAKRPGLLAALAQSQAAVARSKAALTLAKQDQDHTIIRAPVDGVVGDRQVEPGDYVQPGTRLLTVVPMKTLYVTANFKETQVGRMLPGQAASIKVDALPGVKFKGVVDSVAPGSGSEFSLLPFEPGTRQLHQNRPTHPGPDPLLAGAGGPGAPAPGIVERRCGQPQERELTV